MQSTTIAAQATAPGKGGIAIVRISGPEAEPLLASVFCAAGLEGPFESHRMYYGHVMVHGAPLDEGMAVLMRSPRSYTREDVAEVHLHGGEFVVEQLLQALYSLGAQPAQPGEFTRRAFLNGRVDLGRAEAVMQMIAATGERAARAGLRGLQGGASAFVRRAQQQLMDILAGVAASLDYPDEIDEQQATLNLLPQTRALAHSLRAACDQRSARILESGLEVVICGRPNVGKSSLLNLLLGEERAIVTEEAGTTRDIIRGSVLLDGVRINFADTAGIRQSQQRVEQIGIRLAEKAMQGADLTLIVLDQGEPLIQDDLRILEMVRDLPHLVVLNKSDLPPAQGLPQGLLISAQTGEGLEALRKAIVAYAEHVGEGALTLERHMRLAARAADALEEAAAAMEKEEPLDLCAVHLHDALSVLGEVTGDNVTESLLDQVFSQFCVGK